MTPGTESESAFWARCRKEEPRWWIRREVHQLQKLLATYVGMAMESGTKPEAIIEHLLHVRSAILTTTRRNTT